jgi:hypothetical protein
MLNSNYILRTCCCFFSKKILSHTNEEHEQFLTIVKQFARAVCLERNTILDRGLILNHVQYKSV